MGSPFFVLVATVLALSAGTQQIPQTVSVQQCRCADINKCNARIAARTEDCKVNASNSSGRSVTRRRSEAVWRPSRRRLLDRNEARQPFRAADPVMEAPEMYEAEELSSRTHRTDLRSSDTPRRRLKRNPVSCAFKLRCALAPLDETVQTAFLDCQKQLGVDPPRRLRESCECLRGADLTSMQC
ncbi:hypothetical protein QR680_017442 [Steinernema hermaphroditum]|uniref:Uncharacterized protein n=1 Tax=Steinernema hermaphroditum TaxID=289476 RepID=A0AA39HFS1_9BILA|nr:hypothetical protein QR680_017442 [Steinernema hermaphroditum]